MVSLGYCACALVWDEAMFMMAKMLKVLIAILAELQAIRKLLGQRAPGLLFLKTVREENGMLYFVLTLPPAGALDVVSRLVVVTVGTSDPQTFDLLGSDLVTPEMSGGDNDAVVGTLVDTDDAGNASPAREFSFVLVDTIAPPQPGEVGLQVTREE